MGSRQGHLARNIVLVAGLFALASTAGLFRNILIARRFGIGTDLDGGFGREQCPRDLDTIADLQRLQAMFARRGYPPEDIEAILHGNFIRFLKKAWKP